MKELIIAAVALVMVIFVITAIIVGRRQERRRREELARDLNAAGFSHDLDPTPDTQAAAFGDVGAWQSLRNGAKGVQWVAHATLRGLPVTLLGHKYMVSTGKSSHPVYHTIAAVPCPPTWPKLGLTRQNLWHAFVSLFAGKDLQVEDQAFNKRFHVNSEDPDFALLLLSPDVQAFCLTLPDQLVVKIGDGAVSLCVRERSSGAAAARLADQAAELRRRISEELDAWTPAPAE